MSLTIKIPLSSKDFDWWTRYQADVFAWRFRRWLSGGRYYIDHPKPV